MEADTMPDSLRAAIAEVMRWDVVVDRYIGVFGTPPGKDEDEEFPRVDIPALSIRQPWVWAILNAGKDIENRDWHTNRRGWILIHAAKGCTRAEYDDGVVSSYFANPHSPEFPPLAKLDRGGIVGMAKITGCVNHSESPWFVGHYGFTLSEIHPLPFTPCLGALGFFRPDFMKKYR